MCIYSDLILNCFSKFGQIHTLHGYSGAFSDFHIVSHCAPPSFLSIPLSGSVKAAWHHSRIAYTPGPGCGVPLAQVGWPGREKVLASNATMSSVLCSCAIRTVLRNAAHNGGHSGEIGNAPNLTGKKKNYTRNVFNTPLL